MSSILSCHQGVVVATAMAVSGTFILLALRLQKNFPATSQFSGDPITPHPRSCISSEGKRREKKKKRVHFAEDVVDPTGNSEDFRRQHRGNDRNTLDFDSNSSLNKQRVDRVMPANRAALYNGILRDRVVHQRFAYSY